MARLGVSRAVFPWMSNAMPALEVLKRTVERITGFGKPSGKTARAAVRECKAWTSMFKDDGAVPKR